MAPLDGRTWFEHLTEDQCWELVERAVVGRIALLVDGRPEVFPVNHGVHERTVVFRTDDGTKVHGVSRMPWVSFEVDGIDEDRETGWSVLVKGRAEEVVDPAALETLERLGVRFWGVDGKTHWLRIEPDEVTGRRIGHGPADPGS